MICSGLLVDDIGLENNAETRVKSPFGKKLTPNPTPSDSVDPNLARLIESWPNLSESTKNAVLRLIGSG